MAYTREQLRHFRLAREIGRKTGATRSEQKAAIEAMLVESGARNLSYGDRDSVGVLQQRPSQGWAHASDPAKALEDFYSHARQYRGQGLRSGQLAQAVQRSAFPERYGEHAREAKALLKGEGQGGRGYGRAVSGGGDRQQLLLAYLASRDQPDALLNLAMGLQQQQQQPVVSPGRKRGSYGGALKELFYDPAGFKSPGGDHADHVHAAFSSPATAVKVGRLAQRMGLTVREQSAFDPVDPVHAKNSYHYKDEAIDVSGDPRKMARFARKVARLYR